MAIGQVVGSTPTFGSARHHSRFRPIKRMSQDNMVKFECTDCRRVNYHTTRNKKRLAKVRLELKKFCNSCKKHTSHKETK